MLPLAHGKCAFLGKAYLYSIPVNRQMGWEMREKRQETRKQSKGELERNRKIEDGGWVGGP